MEKQKQTAVYKATCFSATTNENGGRTAAANSSFKRGRAALAAAKRKNQHQQHKGEQEVQLKCQKNKKAQKRRTRAQKMRFLESLTKILRKTH